MLIDVLKAVKMLLSFCPKNDQDVTILTALKAVQDVEKKYSHKKQVQRLILIIFNVQKTKFKRKSQGRGRDDNAGR
jgi:hypothetical protein